MEPITQILQKLRSNLPDKNQKEYFEIHVTRYQWILNFIQSLNLPPASKILDIGCYPPHLFNSLSILGYHLFGVSSEHEKISSKNVKTANIETEPLPYPDKSIDFILFSEVFEHLSKNPLNILTESKRVLTDNGYLLITTPNVARSQNLIKIILGQNIYFPIEQLSENINHRHNREYTLSELISLVSFAGLTIEKSGTFISYSPFRQKNRYDKMSLKIIKFLNYLIMKVFPSRADTLFVLARMLYWNIKN